MWGRGGASRECLLISESKMKHLQGCQSFRIHMLIGISAHLFMAGLKKEVCSFAIFWSATHTKALKCGAAMQNAYRLEGLQKFVSSYVLKWSHRTLYEIVLYLFSTVACFPDLVLYSAVHFFALTHVTLRISKVIIRLWAESGGVFFFFG